MRHNEDAEDFFFYMQFIRAEPDGIRIVCLEVLPWTVWAGPNEMIFIILSRLPNEMLWLYLGQLKEGGIFF